MRVFSQPGSADHRLSVVTTPLRVKKKKKALSKHPDADFARYYLGCVKVRVPHRHKGGSFQGVKRNILSARQNPRMVEEYLQKELTQGNIATRSIPFVIYAICAGQLIRLHPKETPPRKVVVDHGFVPPRKW